MEEMKMAVMERMEQVERILQERGFDFSLSWMEKPANNSEPLYGFGILEKGRCGGPVFYYSKEYERLSDQELADEIIRFYGNLKQVLEKMEQVTLDHIMDSVLPRIYHQSNYEKFKKAGYVCGIVFDFAVTFYIPVPGFEEGEERASVILNEKLVDPSLAFETIFNQAMKNLKSKTVVRSMRDVLMNFMEMSPGGLPFPDLSDFKPQFLILTTDSEQFGAAAILDLHLLQKLYHYYSEEPFYLLPSSIHEILTLPATAFEEDELREMVTDINQVAVKPEEVLADQVYFYNGSSLTIPGEERFYGTL